jgi:hypothetical protein
MTRADEIRKYVVKHFARVGKFKSRDVLTATEEWPSSNVSSALNDFASRNMIVDGYRLVKDTERAVGRVQVWELVSADAEPRKSSSGGTFSAKILKANNATGTMIVAANDEVYKVIPVDWS